MICTWAYSKIVQYLTLDVVPDRDSYRPGQGVRLRIRLTNRHDEAYLLPPELMNRSAHILFMERGGRGFFLISLKTLFGRRRRLRINPGRSIRTTVTLNIEDISETTRVLHYDLPEKIRTFQLFLPLAEEDPDGYSNMLSFNTVGVTVADSWIR